MRNEDIAALEKLVEIISDEKLSNEWEKIIQKMKDGVELEENEERTLEILENVIEREMKKYAIY